MGHKSVHILIRVFFFLISNEQVRSNSFSSNYPMIVKDINSNNVCF